LAERQTIPGYAMPPEMDQVKGSVAKATVVDPGSQLIFVTGMVALSDDGSEVLFPNDTEGQCRHIYEAMQELLEGLGSSLEDVVRITVYMTDLSDVLATLEVRERFWPTDPPSSTTVGISQLGLPTDSLRIEIDAIAAVPPGGRQ